MRKNVNLLGQYLTHSELIQIYFPTWATLRIDKGPLPEGSEFQDASFWMGQGTDQSVLSNSPGMMNLKKS